MYIGAAQETQKQWQTEIDGIREKSGEAVLHTCEDFDGKLLNMMQSLSDALQWEMKFLKIQNSSQCLTDEKMP